MKENNEELEARIAAYIDGQLPAADAARLEVFLANTDPALAEQVIGMIAERHAVRALPKPKAPDDLAARIMEQVERATLLSDVEHFTAPRRPWWQSRVAVAAALFLVLGGFTWFILEAVRRPTSSWREAVMDDGTRREDTSRIAMAPPSAGPIGAITSPAASAPSGIALDSAVSSNATTLAGAATVSPAAPTPPAPDAATALATAAQSQSTLFGNKSQPSAPPVTLALVARDAEDYTRLRSRLEEFASANPEAGRNQLALNSGKDMSDSLQHEANGGGGGGGLAAPQQNSQNIPTQNNSNGDEQFAARAAAKALPAQERSASGYTFNNQRQFGAASTNTLENRGANSAPLTYHLSLRADQIQQLTQEFQTQSPQRDRRAVVNTKADDLPSSVPLARAKSSSQAGGDLAKDKSTEALVDCIITMAPPVPATSPAPPPAPPSTIESPATQPGR